MASAPRVAAPRALQLDAHRLHDELLAAHEAALAALFARLPQHSRFPRAPPALLRAALALWHYAPYAARGAPPAGLSLLGLRYGRATVSQRLVCVVLAASLPLVRGGAGDAAATVRAAAALAALAAALVRADKPPALHAAVAGLHVTGTAAPQTDLLDRQLLLSAAADLALAVLPAVRLAVSAVRARLPRLPALGGGGDAGSGSGSGGGGVDGGGSGGGGVDGRGAGAMTRACVFCQMQPAMPHVLVPCRCVACYFCAAASPPPACPRCGAAVAAHARLTYA